MKINYIELGDNYQQQDDDLLSRRSDEINDYLESNEPDHVSTVLYSDINRQIHKIDSGTENNNDDKTLIYVRHLEQLPQIKQIITKRSAKLAGISQKYLGQFVKYDIIGENNSQLVIQTIKSSNYRVPYSEVFKNSIPVDQLLKILKRFIKIIFYLHQQGINYLDLSEGNFELDIQTYKPSMIAVPLCIRGDITQSESCFRDFEELGLVMLKLVNTGQIQFANELSFEQIRLKNCVLKICQEFIDCRHIANNLQDFIQRQLSRLTCIKQISQSISQSVEEVNVKQFIPNKITSNSQNFHRQIETLEIDILGVIPEAYRSSSSYESKKCKERWLNKILCTLAFILAIILIVYLWNQRNSPFECFRNQDKSDTLMCKIKLEKQGSLYSSYQLDQSIKNLSLDFRDLRIQADKIINIVSSIDFLPLSFLSLNAYGNDIKTDGFKQLLIYLTDSKIADRIDLNIYNTPVSSNYLNIYKVNATTAYERINDLYQFYQQQTNQQEVKFNLICDFTGYFNALNYIEQNKNTTNIHGNKNLFLQNKKLKDSEAWYIIDELYKSFDNKQEKNDYFYHIDLSNNDIEGQCLVQFIQKYIKSNMNFNSLHFSISNNPISNEKYNDMIEQFQQLNLTKKIQLDLDLFQFYQTDYFVDQTFYQRKSNLKYFELEIYLKDLSVKNIYSISKYMADKYIPFNIIIQSNFYGIDQFVDSFPFGNEFCSKQDKQLNTNQQYQVHIISSLTRVKEEEKICFQDQKQNNLSSKQQGLDLQTLEISSHQRIRKEMLIQNNDNKEYSIELVYHENKVKEYEDAAGTLLQNSQYTNLKNIIISDNYISDEGITNIVQLGLRNIYLKTLKIQLEFILMSKNSISKLLDIISKHQSLEQLTLILNQETFTFENQELESQSTTEEVLDVIANSIKQSQSLKSIYLQEKDINFPSFKNIIKVFEEQPSLANLTLYFNMTHSTFKDIRDMYIEKRRLADRQKNLSHISHDVNFETDIYEIAQYYERILFHLREPQKSVFISSSFESLLNRQMIDDFISEIDYAKCNTISVNAHDDNFNTQDFMTIIKKISKNSYTKNFEMYSYKKIIYKRQEVNEMFNYFAENVSLEKLLLFIFTEQEPKNIDIAQQLKQFIISSKIINLDLNCENCFDNYEKFDDILNEIFKSKYLKYAHLNDIKYLNDQNNKRIAFMAVASDKILLNPQQKKLNAQQEQFKKQTEEFKQILEDIQFKFSLSNSYISDFEMEFLNKYIERLGQKKEISINLANNNITDKGLKQFTDQLKKQQNTEQLNIELQNNQLSDQACSLIMESISSNKLKSLKLNFTQNRFVGNQCFQSIENNLKKYIELTEISLDIPYLGESGFYKTSELLTQLSKLNRISLNIEEESLSIQQAKDIGTMLGKQQNIESISIKGQSKKILEQYFNLQKQLNQAKTTQQIDIDLSSTIQYPQSLESILNQIDNNIKIFDINLSSNKLDEESVKVVSQFIEKQSLTLNQLSINISDNPVDQKSCNTISESINKLKQLESFSYNIRNTKMDDKCLSKLGENMKSLEKMRSVKIIANDLSEEQKQDVMNIFKQLNISITINN